MKRFFIAALMLAAAIVSAEGRDRYEAHTNVTAVCQGSDSQACRVALASASEGFYVRMNGGDITFTVNVPADGFYTFWAFYSQTYDGFKEQYLDINGTRASQMAFPATGAIDGPPVFEMLKAAGKVRMTAGANTVTITRSWGWVDIDYIEVAPFVPEPFNISPNLINPNATANARKMYQFMLENFQKKVISGVMTNRVAQDDGQYTPHTLNTQVDISYMKTHSGKFPAMVGLDFMHSTGLKSEDDWFRGYHNATLALAEEIYKAGGFPIYCWHWKDPLRKKEESAFYTADTDFDLRKAFTDNTYDTWNTSSPEYIAMLSDIDFIAGELKKLADKDVTVLWRPLHEAAGGWFWWGRDREPKPCAQLWRLMYDRMTNHHELNNLIWVWTTEESGRELEWYPGDEYADIIARDWYPNPNQLEKTHRSLMSNFENIKDIFSGRKIIGLGENAAIPYPDSLIDDGAHWSWFMSWYGHYLTTPNLPADINHIMNHSYVITLEDMPGWENYALNTTGIKSGVTTKKAAPGAVSVRSSRGALELRINGAGAQTVELFNLKGARIAVLSKEKLAAGNHRFPTRGIARQMSIVRVKTVDGRVMTLPVRIE